MDPVFFTRCYSPASVGSFTSGKLAVGRERKNLKEKELLDEFRKHRFLSNREPTALVSVSSLIIRTLSCALVQWCGKDEDEYQTEPQPADEIFIAFIAVPAQDSGIYHHAKALASQLGDITRDMKIYQSEYIFEWEIPPKYILHTVSLQTLMDNGLGIERYIDGDGRAPSTDTLRSQLANYYFGDPVYEYEAGLDLGFMARCFGARAPVYSIAEQFIDNLWYRSESKISREQIDDGVHTAFVDWWLNEYDSTVEYHEYKEWASALENCMIGDYGFLYADMCAGMYSDQGKIDQKLRMIEERHELMRQDIERAALELGL